MLEVLERGGAFFERKYILGLLYRSATIATAAIARDMLWGAPSRRQFSVPLGSG